MQIDPLQNQTSSSWFFKCYLCPGNKRAQGDLNPQYKSTFVFVNDYSAVKEEQAEYKQQGDPNGYPTCLLDSATTY
jgi:UDPglucose--hexose-1-phosphate uridylyltransferase